jgi:uncharacterized protein (TIGR02246 family)
MKRIAMFLGTTAIALMAAACNQSADTHDADVKAIKNIEIQWNQDYVSKDADKLAAHYAQDAVLMVPEMPAISGKDAIRTSMAQMTADPALALTFQPSKVEVAKSGDLAYTQGSYSITVTDSHTKKVVNGHGSYVTVYRKQADGTWKAVSDIATSDAPPAAPPAAKGKKHAEAKKHVSAKKHHAR